MAAVLLVSDPAVLISPVEDSVMPVSVPSAGLNCGSITLWLVPSQSVGTKPSGPSDAVPGKVAL